ncbi:hypothetical protein N7474_006802 [Penicillium riverlandense]|uniref:uncharacterized protein n=1 Tax=Penicillium riverlandense TaxID=1903569 RepID=UPI002547A49E|nr:uncharacterized protein N7474_006802 [Penicillium riverlandense]KAJ5815025.1 hypothetical protein N7474_006802 [Penicillium riverlandense]
MRAFTTISVLSTLTLLLSFSPSTGANPIATPVFVGDHVLNLEKRCENPCGWHDKYCCSANQACQTNAANEAICVDGGSGSWEYFTSTWVVTEAEVSTVTSVWSSHIMTAAPTAGGLCNYEYGESKCGAKCCGKDSVCVQGVCVLGSSSFASTGAGAQATPPVRGTSNGMSTVTQTDAPTATEGFIAPVSTDGSELIGAKATVGGGGLSGGAIAGIVIGVIFGIIFLLLLCACMCFKGAVDGLLAALGFRNRRRRETVVEERVSHHSGSRPPRGRTWFGTRPAATDSEVSEKKSKWGNWATIALVLGALALCLGLKRHRDREHDDDKSDHTYPSDYYSDYYSEYYTNSSMFVPSVLIEPIADFPLQVPTVRTDELEIHDGHDGRAPAHGVDDNESN